MLTTFLAHAPSDVCGISPVLKTLATSSHERGLQCDRPLGVDLGQPPVHYDVPDNRPDNCPLLVGVQLVVCEVGLVDFRLRCLTRVTWAALPA
jgi:hypothetical protein